MIGGALADVTADFLLLVTRSARRWGATVLLLEADPRWDLGVGLGSLAGLFFGLVAIIDAAILG